MACFSKANFPFAWITGLTTDPSLSYKHVSKLQQFLTLFTGSIALIGFWVTR
jgi:hypothetical protein